MMLINQSAYLRLLLQYAVVIAVLCRNHVVAQSDKVQTDASINNQRVLAVEAPEDVGCMREPLQLMYLSERYGINITSAEPDVVEALLTVVTGGLAIGSTTELICEANDASRVEGVLVEDGLSGDINFPFGKIKALATVGEVNSCVNDESRGDSFTGVPDGMGAYLVDDDTLRIVVQSESYGTITQQETWPYEVNGGAATFTGSHVHFLDFDRFQMAFFMTHDGPASYMIKSFGQTATTYYNLAGEFVGPRNADGPTEYGAHYSNTDSDGNYVVQGQEGSPNEPTQADWIMQSLCSAHLEERHQWGPGIGFEDTVYLTNEEWINYQPDKAFVGISAHVQDLANRVDYAIGAVTNSGFEKIVELNPQHEDYIILGVSGYNGDFNDVDFELDARNAEFGPRPDGEPYVAPENVVPTRIYVGVKGKMEDGSDALDSDDFLARNGLRYGKVYGFAVDMTENGPTSGMYRDDFHKPRANGARVEGKFVAIDWSWDGVVRNFRYDGAWDFQMDPPNQPDGWDWWTAAGRNTKGAKTEHLSPDTREGNTAFVQGSTAGYFGHFYVNNVKAVLDGANGALPTEFEAEYYVYQGEQDISAQIDLGDAGLYALYPDICPLEEDASGFFTALEDATYNCDSPGSVKSTFEDIDGLEVIAAKEGLFAVIQEDSGNELGERMFITKLSHEGNELEYNFVAMSGGEYNTRMSREVGIPAGTNQGASAHEFSGVIDLSGMLAMIEVPGVPGDGGVVIVEDADPNDPNIVGPDPTLDSEGPVGKLIQLERNFTTTFYNPDGSINRIERNSTLYFFPSSRRHRSLESDTVAFVVPAGDGYAKRTVEFEVSINDKLMALGLQAHNLEKGGAVEAFMADRGGQLLAYQPNLDVFDDGALQPPTTAPVAAPTVSAPTVSEPTAGAPTATDADSLDRGGQRSDDRSLFVAHGVLASIAWTLLVPLAIGSSFIRKVLIKWGMHRNDWFQIHRALNGLAAIFTLIAFSIAMSVDTHLNTTHHGAGVAVLVLTIIQAILGFLAPNAGDPSKTSIVTRASSRFLGADAAAAMEKPEEVPDDDDHEMQEENKKKEEASKSNQTHEGNLRMAWEIFHRLLGAILVGLAWWQVQSGLKLFSDRFEEDSKVHVFWIVLVIVIATIAALAVYQRTALSS